MACLLSLTYYVKVQSTFNSPQRTDEPVWARSGWSSFVPPTKALWLSSWNASQWHWRYRVHDSLCACFFSSKFSVYPAGNIQPSSELGKAKAVGERSGTPPRLHYCWYKWSLLLPSHFWHLSPKIFMKAVYSLAHIPRFTLQYRALRFGNWE